ncbi:MAG: adenylate/guanylate cyclase domain-containing protein [Ruminococcaceae bacterium]|nr:adenylate/guanylate cyclase domain-containing protein [Oscillospiraceae bacterium]
MEVTNRIFYDVEKSAKRIDDILDASNSNYSDRDSIPARTSLTYTNGFYVNITALFIDIVGSSDMTDEHRRPTLAKMYRAFISECTALMNASDLCKEININGDCVWGVFETPYKSHVDSVFSIAAQLNSLIEILNYKLEKKGYSKISVGIGMDDGRALMVKAGYSGSGLNDVIWMGDVVNSACHLANKAGRNGKHPVLISGVVYSNLNDHNQSIVYKTLLDGNTVYHGYIYDVEMREWYDDNCK